MMYNKCVDCIKNDVCTYLLGNEVPKDCKYKVESESLSLDTLIGIFENCLTEQRITIDKKVIKSVWLYLCDYKNTEVVDRRDYSQERLEAPDLEDSEWELK